jgi:hypothetical protein
MVLSACAGSAEDAADPARVTESGEGERTATQGTASRDQDVAEQAALTTADLGPDWTVAEAEFVPLLAAEVNCLVPDAGGLEVTGDWTSDSMVAGPPVLIMAGKAFPRAGHAITSYVKVYGSEGEADDAFRRAASNMRTQELADCLSRANQPADGPDIGRMVARLWSTGGSASSADNVKAVRWELRVRESDESVVVDFVLLRERRAVAGIVLSSVDIPATLSPFTADDVFLALDLGLERLRAQAQER